MVADSRDSVPPDPQNYSPSAGKGQPQWWPQCPLRPSPIEPPFLASLYSLDPGPLERPPGPIYIRNGGPQIKAKRWLPWHCESTGDD